MESLASTLRASIETMTGDNSGVSVSLFDKSSSQFVQVTVGPKDTVESIKSKLQDALGTSPEFVNLTKKDGSPFGDSDVASLVTDPSLTDSTRELVYEVNLSGGAKVQCACAHVSCCQRSPRFTCLFTLCFCFIGEVPKLGGGWGVSQIPGGRCLGVGASCCGICSVGVGPKPKFKAMGR